MPRKVLARPTGWCLFDVDSGHLTIDDCLVPITFRCPEGHKLTVADALAGRKARCPACRRKMFVPDDNTNPKQMARAADETPDSSLARAASLDEAPTLVVAALSAGDELLTSTPAAGDIPLTPIDLPQPDHRSAANIYRADADKLQTVRLLVIGLAITALFTAGPIIWHRNLLTAPDWVRFVVFLSILQLAYVAWLATMPDWVSVWVAMLVNALIATLYGAALAIFLYTPSDSPLAFGLNEVSRRTAAGWCLCVVLITSMMGLVCGRVCAAWRRADDWKRRRQLLSGQ